MMDVRRSRLLPALALAMALLFTVGGLAAAVASGARLGIDAADLCRVPGAPADGDGGDDQAGHACDLCLACVWTFLPAPVPAAVTRGALRLVRTAAATPAAIDARDIHHRERARAPPLG